MAAQPPHLDADVRAGLAASIGAFVLWGVTPLYFHLLTTDAFAILAHRVVWSAPVLAFALWVTGAHRDVFALRAAPKTFAILVLTAFLIAANWSIFIWAVTHDRILETSLGYYINPLMNVALGVVLLKEPLKRAQFFALSLAAAGVAVQIWAVGSLPWVSMVLPLLFALYGFFRKIAAIGALPGLSVEVALVTPAALAFLAFWPGSGGVLAGGAVAGVWTWETLLLMLSGPVTIAPLLLFNLGTKRLRYSTIGALQFIAPSLSFCIGLSLGEPFSSLRFASFALIWAGLLIYTIDSRRTPHDDRADVSSKFNRKIRKLA